jgi:hypothetical protein
MAVIILFSAAVGCAKVPESRCRNPVKPDLGLLMEQLAFEVEIPSVPFRRRVPGPAMIVGQPPTTDMVVEYAPLLIEELGIYPRGFVRRTKLHRVVLCTDLRVDEHPRGAAPDFLNHVLYLDVCASVGPIRHRRKCIHHELFHIVDYEDDGVLYDDEEWKRLNPAGFRYGPGGAEYRDVYSFVYFPYEDIPGFLNEYSTYGVEEDKAEVFAALILERDYVEWRLKTDPVIRDKVEFMKDLLLHFSCDMGEEFWRSLEACGD